MQDSTIKYTVTASGIEEVTAKMNALGAVVQKLNINKNGTVTASGKSAAALNNESNAANNNARSVDRASKAHSNYLVHIAKTTVLSAIVNKSFLGISEAAGAAVKQVDLFANFPATMKAMGVSAADSTAALKTLRTFTAGIGGDLNEAATSVTRFTEVTRNVKASVAEFVGVKNALIAGGAGAEVQKNALEQLTQAYSRGVPQLVEWRSLMIAMPLQLSIVAKALKLPNANALGEALTKGKISMQEFMTELTKLGTGTGPIAQQAIARMQGIEFATNVMKNAMTNGIAAIIQAIGRQNIIAFFNFLTQVITVTSQAVVFLVNAFINLFNIVSRLFGGPQLATMAKDTGVAAGNTGDLAANFDDAADSAKDIKKSLAAFDKMNVLPDKKDKATKTTGPLDPATAKALEGIFGNINGNLAKAGLAAKIFAGILAGLLGNALISKLFGVDPLKGLIDGLSNAAKKALGLNKNLKDVGDEAGKAGAKASESFAKKFTGGLSKGASAAVSGISGFFTGLGALLAPKIAIAGTAILGAIDSFILVPAVELLGGLAIALGLPFEAVVAVVAIAIAAIIGILWLIWTNWDKIWGFIKLSFNVTVKAIIDTWNTLYGIFKGPVEFFVQFWKAMFILVVAIVAIALESIFKLITGTISLIYNVLAAVAGWISINVIQPVANLFAGLWNGLATGLKAAWDFIFKNILLPVVSRININVIQPILGFFVGLWNGVSGVTSSFISKFFGVFAPLTNWVSVNVINPIAGFFRGLWDGVKKGLSGVFDFFRSIFGSLGGVIKAPINGVIDIINSLFGSFNKIKVPDWVPGFGGQTVSFPGIPIRHLAKGGVVTQATMAMVGEQGKEAIVPLESNTEWIDELASKINGNGRDSNSNDTHIPSRLESQQTQAPTYNITVEGVFATSVAEQRRIADQILKRIKESNGYKTAGAF